MSLELNILEDSNLMKFKRDSCYQDHLTDVYIYMPISTDATALLTNVVAGRLSIYLFFFFIRLKYEKQYL